MHADPLSVYLHCVNNANIWYSYNSFLTGVFIIHITEHITQKSVDVKATWLCDFFCVHVYSDEICQITRITHQSCLNESLFLKDLPRIFEWMAWNLAGLYTTFHNEIVEIFRELTVSRENPRWSAMVQTPFPTLAGVRCFYFHFWGFLAGLLWPTICGHYNTVIDFSNPEKKETILWVCSGQPHSGFVASKVTWTFKKKQKKLTQFTISESLWKHKIVREDDL